MADLGKLMIGIGLAISLLGLVLTALSRLGGRTSWLPGDIVIHRPGFTFAFPLVTSLVLSLLLTLVMLLIARFRR